MWPRSPCCMSRACYVSMELSHLLVEIRTSQKVIIIKVSRTWRVCRSCSSQDMQAEPAGSCVAAVVWCSNVACRVRPGTMMHMV